MYKQAGAVALRRREKPLACGILCVCVSTFVDRNDDLREALECTHSSASGVLAELVHYISACTETKQALC